MKARLSVFHVPHLGSLSLTWKLRPSGSRNVYIVTSSRYEFLADARRAAKRAAKRLGIEIVEEQQ